MALKILAAGFDKDTRAHLEGVVRRTLGARVGSETWSISLVKAGARLAVTLDGPEERFRHLSFAVEESQLAKALGAALSGGVAAGASHAATAAPPAALPSPAGTGRDQHVCEHCRAAYVVLYETRPDDVRQLVSVACPHCWKTNHVEVGSWAASGREYRAEKA